MTQKLLRPFLVAAGLAAFAAISPAAAQDAACPNNPDDRQSAENRSNVGQFAARKCEPRPYVPPTLYDEVFVVTGVPRRPQEARTVKEAYYKVKSGGIIYIVDVSAGISDDGAGLTITKPVTIDLDSDLRTRLDIVGANGPVTQRATLTAASDGTCFTLAQDGKQAALSGLREPRLEVTIRSVNIAVNPAGPAGTCIAVREGTLFLDNVEIGDGNSPFRTGIAVTSGRVNNVQNARVFASDVGVDIVGGQFDSTEDAFEIFSAGGAASPVALNQGCAPSVKSAHSIGLYAGEALDKRTGDPQVVGRVDIEGFDIGVCAHGNGVELNESAIAFNGVGVLADNRMTLRYSAVTANDIVGLLLNDPEGEFLQNDIVSNRKGVVVGWEEKFNRSGVSGPFKRFDPYTRQELRYQQEDQKDHPPLLHRNIVAFNGRGIGLLAPEPYSGQELLDRYYTVDITANTVACNITAGVVAEMNKFRKRNISRKENSERFCTREKRDDFCGRLELNFVRNAGCGGVEWMRNERATTLYYGYVRNKLLDPESSIAAYLSAPSTDPVAIAYFQRVDAQIKDRDPFSGFARGVEIASSSLNTGIEAFIAGEPFRLKRVSPRGIKPDVAPIPGVTVENVIIEGIAQSRSDAEAAEAIEALLDIAGVDFSNREVNHLVDEAFEAAERGL